MGNAGSSNNYTHVLTKSTVKCSIILDHEEHEQENGGEHDELAIVKSGKKLTGRVEMNLLTELPPSAKLIVILQLEGKEISKITSHGHVATEEKKIKDAKQVLVLEEFNTDDDDNEDRRIKPGIYYFPFKLPIPKKIPSTTFHKKSSKFGGGGGNNKRKDAKRMGSNSCCIQYWLYVKAQIDIPDSNVPAAVRSSSSSSSSPKKFKQVEPKQPKRSVSLNTHLQRRNRSSSPTSSSGGNADKQPSSTSALRKKSSIVSSGQGSVDTNDTGFFSSSKSQNRSMSPNSIRYILTKRPLNITSSDLLSITQIEPAVLEPTYLPVQSTSSRTYAGSVGVAARIPQTYVDRGSRLSLFLVTQIFSASEAADKIIDIDQITISLVERIQWKAKDLTKTIEEIYVLRKNAMLDEKTNKKRETIQKGGGVLLGQSSHHRNRESRGDSLDRNSSHHQNRHATTTTATTSTITTIGNAPPTLSNFPKRTTNRFDDGFPSRVAKSSNNFDEGFPQQRNAANFGKFQKASIMKNNDLFLDEDEDQIIDEEEEDEDEQEENEEDQGGEEEEVVYLDGIIDDNEIKQRFKQELKYNCNMLKLEIPKSSSTTTKTTTTTAPKNNSSKTKYCRESYRGKLICVEHFIRIILCTQNVSKQKRVGSNWIEIPITVC